MRITCFTPKRRDRSPKIYSLPTECYPNYWLPLDAKIQSASPGDRRQGVDRAALEHALVQIIADSLDGRQRLVGWRRRVSAYSSSCVITHLWVSLADPDRELQIGFKNLTHGLELSTAHRVRPGFLYHAEREILIYQRVLSRLDLGTPRFLGARIDLEEPACWLFLDWVRGPLLWQLGRIRHWQEAAGWLARLHREASEHRVTERSLQAAHAARYDTSAYAVWVSRAESALGNGLLRKDRQAARRFGRIVRRYDRVVDFLSHLPKTLVHGEFFPANIVMRWNGEEHQVCPIDWELTGWGPQALDLAALTMGQWSSSEKGKMVTAYHDHARADCSTASSREELEEAVTYCQLHLCLRHLGWATRWRPQGQATARWLSDAFDLAETLGL